MHNSSRNRRPLPSHLPPACSPCPMIWALCMYICTAGICCCVCCGVYMYVLPVHYVTVYVVCFFSRFLLPPPSASGLRCPSLHDIAGCSFVHGFAMCRGCATGLAESVSVYLIQCLPSIPLLRLSSSRSRRHLRVLVRRPRRLSECHSCPAAARCIVVRGDTRRVG